MLKKKTYVLKTAGVAAILLTFVGVAHAAFSANSWQYYRDISTPNSGATGFVKAQLPDDISRGGNNFDDLRIENQDNVEIPYLITQNAVVRGGQNYARVLDKTNISGQTVFIIDTSASGQIYTGMNLDIPNQNYRRQVSVYSSSSLLPVGNPSWNIVTNKGFIFRYTDSASGYTSGKNNIDFSANTSRYFKVVISGGEEGNIDVNSVSIYGERRVDIPTYSQTIPITTSNNTQKRTTEVLIDLGTSGHLTNAITLYPSDQNYIRRVNIETTNDISTTTGSWNYVGSASISRISTTLFDGASNRITYPEQKTRYIRLSIVNDDNRPLSIGANALIEGSIFSVIFETRPGESYRLFYGNPQVSKPTYDITAISSYIEANKLPQVSLGVEKENSSYVAPEAPAVPFGEAHKGALNSVLLIVVIILAGGIAFYIYSYTNKKE